MSAILEFLLSNTGFKQTTGACRLEIAKQKVLVCLGRLAAGAGVPLYNVGNLKSLFSENPKI